MSASPLPLAQRARILRALRAHFDAQGFIEIEAPVLVVSPGMEPHLDAFEVKRSPEPDRRFLHTSPEYALKRLLGEGYDRIYSLGPCFRDEPTSSTHSPEFTMLEWYQKGLDLEGLMAQTEAAVASACRAIHGGTDCVYRGQQLSLSPPFERMSVQQAFKRFARIDPWQYAQADTLRMAARMAGVAVPTDSGSWDDVFFQIFLNAVEPRLGRSKPTLLHGWPASQAALARLDPFDPRRALRFELYAGGIELANAFDELTDAEEQRSRFQKEQVERSQMGKTVLPIDEQLLEALPRMGPTSGIALGVDRLVMLLLDAPDISHVRAQPWRGW
ncbi:MAG: EF-P lysine aminoacylase EpmA [Bradymonadia bacterium]